MDVNLISLFWTIAIGLVAGGAAWGGSVMALKAVRDEQISAKEDRIKIQTDLEKHMSSDLTIQMDLVNRLARIEGKIDTTMRRTPRPT
jgi:hypothetical protein